MELVKITKQKVNDLIKGRRKATLFTLKQLLEPIGLVLDIGLKETWLTNGFLCRIKLCEVPHFIARKYPTHQKNRMIKKA